MDKKLKARLFVLLVFIACAAPVALSFFTYYVWKPQKRMNYGELLQAQPLSLAGLKTLSGEALPDDAWRGKWVLLQVDAPACDANCERRLYAMRQTALAMVMKKDKLRTVWVLSAAGQPSKELLAQYPDTRVVLCGEKLIAALPQPALNHILLLDPNGVPVLRYPESPDIARMMKDMGRLLDVKRM